MSLFTQALAGAGSAAADLSNRYIDDEILRNRQQAFLDMQRRNTQQTREDDYAFRNDPTRVANDRNRQVEDITAVEGARGKVALDAKRAEVTDQGITQGMAARERAVGQVRNDVAVEGARAMETDEGITAGRVGRAKAVAQAESDVRIESQRRALTELGGLEASVAGQKADAIAKAQAKYREPSQKNLTPAEQITQLEDALGRKLTPDEREAKLGLSKVDGSAVLQKMATEAAGKAVEAGTIKPEEAGVFASRIMSGFKNEQISRTMAPIVSKARAKNDVPSLIAELSGQGFSREQMLGFGISAEELKSAESKPNAATPGAAPAAPQDKQPATYGLMSGPRMKYLQSLKDRGQINPAEQAELEQLLQSRGGAWFRGRASEADYGGGQ